MILLTGISENYLLLIQAGGALLSAFASVLLAYLYRGQKTLLDRSFRAENKAILEAGRLKIDEENTRIKLANVGNGVGTDPELVCIATYVLEDSADEQFVDGKTRYNLRRAETEQRQFGSAVEPGEREVTYECRTGLPEPYGFSPSDPQTVFKDLQDRDVTVARIHYFLRWSDQTENARASYLSTTEFDPNTGVEHPDEDIWNPVPIPFDSPEYDPATDRYSLPERLTSPDRIMI